MTQAAGTNFSNQSDEIEKILAEIEGIESKSSNTSQAQAKSSEGAEAATESKTESRPTASSTTAESTTGESTDFSGELETASTSQNSANVISIKGTRTTAGTESLMETDAHVVHPDPLAFESSGDTGHGNNGNRGGLGATSTEQGFGGGGLAMRVGGCQAISLEFEQNGVRVTLTLEKDTLAISTDSGAEFRVPLRGREVA